MILDHPTFFVQKSIIIIIRQTGSGPATGAATIVVSVDLESSLGLGGWTADAATVAASIVYLGVGGEGGDDEEVGRVACCAHRVRDYLQ